MFKKFQRWKKDQSDAVRNLSEKKRELLKSEIPDHVAIIMDGNGRWAQKRALPRIMGHHEGMKVVRHITKTANELGIKVLTLYAFSTENWKRPKPEVEFLMKLPVEFLGTFLPELIEENVQVRIMGDATALPPHTLKAVNQAIDDTKHNTGLILNFALNYGSRYEMMEAMKAMMKDHQEGRVKEPLSEELFSTYLMSGGLPDPDLLIRTSGELRVSNFMLWQLAYTEFWFTDVLWPDFTDALFVQAVEDYQNRGRRFGGV
ncbi:isoprenyl transferase [Priestia koreensis]|uniref:Isoprenyl transferase n=1 Tax=Priestia koreensis TaxID=284581 RepID=A0A0M0L684_9BACI|nr:isoprenyl transferase [Priestia koreensis]KOO46585.1 UDP pyrophosphate synthase [Priestia koreensis]